MVVYYWQVELHCINQIYQILLQYENIIYYNSQISTDCDGSSTNHNILQNEETDPGITDVNNISTSRPSEVRNLSVSYTLPFW